MQDLSLPERRLIELGYTLPAPPPPAANYVPFVVCGDMVHISGQIPLDPEGAVVLGRLGEQCTVEQAQEAARKVALALIAQLREACGGDLDRVVRVVKLGGFVACTPDFRLQSRVIDAASDMMIAVFGEAGRHARAAVGVASLPLGVPVEIDGLFQIRPPAP